MFDRLLTRLTPLLVLIMWIVAISPFVERMVTDDMLAFHDMLHLLDSSVSNGIFIIGALVIANLLVRHIAALIDHVDVQARRSAETIATIFTSALRKEWRARRDKVDT